jgi:DNA-binding GntR family transcriptional regulator
MSRVSGVTELVRVMILRGDFGYGGHLVEFKIAERLGVRRPTLREALRRLEGEGLLVADPSGGMRVVAIGEDELAATLELRAPLEALSTGLAAAAVREGEAGDGALRSLEALAEAPAPAVLADAHFHRGIAALHGNQPCRDALDRVWDRIVLAAAHRVGSARVAVEEHREILAAVTAGDETAATALARRHALA